MISEPSGGDQILEMGRCGPPADDGKSSHLFLLREPVWYTSCKASILNLLCQNVSSTSVNLTKTQNIDDTQNMHQKKL